LITIIEITHEIKNPITDETAAPTIGNSNNNGVIKIILKEMKYYLTLNIEK
jgi:flagellar assembly factor FliW